MDMKQRFCKKLYEELTAFKVSTLQESKEDILGSSYKTEVFVNLYEILIESVDSISDVLLSNLVNQSTNILETFYNSFLSSSEEDPMYAELKHHVERELDEESGEYNRWDNLVYA